MRDSQWIPSVRAWEVFEKDAHLCCVQRHRISLMTLSVTLIAATQELCDFQIVDPRTTTLTTHSVLMRQQHELDSDAAHSSSLCTSQGYGLHNQLKRHMTQPVSLQINPPTIQLKQRQQMFISGPYLQLLLYTVLNKEMQERPACAWKIYCRAILKVG